ncbi:MAG: hypothetical protein CAPSK01_000535 [Candidatus Accumulibacter vicinus]|uniref:Uncharacterized protein n=1 Tax=Candidatus Accumulibacter vicinus TaxID=2954382 RepID=A0A084Y528_9PROT|nr:MAG: hypothetical protein CAPSK01_000535 [Candidatus Accumulibacter vicinus]
MPAACTLSSAATACRAMRSSRSMVAGLSAKASASSSPPGSSRISCGSAASSSKPSKPTMCSPVSRERISASLRRASVASWSACLTILSKTRRASDNRRARHSVRVARSSMTLIFSYAPAILSPLSGWSGAAFAGRKGCADHAGSSALGRSAPCRSGALSGRVSRKLTPGPR